MGRTNGNGPLIPFLKKSLADSSHDNLKWEDELSGIFNLNLTRYEKKKQFQSCEKILKDWYTVTGKADKYPGYSYAKVVVQAALNKSVYLVSLPRVSSKHPLRFKFANQMEIEENRRKQKHKEVQKHSQNTPPSSPSISESSGCQTQSTLPPSPSTSESSGYQSGNDNCNENIEADESNYCLDDLINNPEKFIDINDNFSDILDEIGDGNIQSTGTGMLPALPDDPCSSIQNLVKPAELNITKFDPMDFLNTYWQCTEKQQIGSTLILICEKRVIPSSNPEIEPNQIRFPIEFLEARNYTLQNQFEINGKYLVFLSPDN